MDPLPVPEEKQTPGNLSIPRLAEKAAFDNNPTLFANLLRVIRVQDLSDSQIVGLLQIIGTPCLTYNREEMARSLVKAFDMEGPYDLLTQLLFYPHFPQELLRFFYSVFPERKPAVTFVKLIDGEDADKMAFAFSQVEKIFGEVSTDTYYELFNYSIDSGNRVMTHLLSDKIRQNSVFAPIPDWMIPNEAPDTPPEPEERHFIMPNEDKAVNLIGRVLDKVQFEAEYNTEVANLPPLPKEADQPSSVKDARLEEEEEDDEEWNTGEYIDLDNGLPTSIQPPPPRKTANADETRAPTIRHAFTDDAIHGALVSAYRKLPAAAQESLVELSAEQTRVYELESDVTLFRYYGPSNFKLASVFIDKKFVCARLGCREMTCVCSDADDKEEVDIDIGEIDWFAGSCDRCFRRIRTRFHSVRLPSNIGGYSGCFCSEFCVKTFSNENGGTELELALIDLDLERKRELGIWDRSEKPIFPFYNYPEQNWTAESIEVEFEHLQEPTTTEDSLSQYVVIRSD